MLPLVIEAIQDPAGGVTKRSSAVVSLGQVVESTGCVMAPYMDFPQLLALLLRMLAEGSSEDTRSAGRLHYATGNTS